MRPAWVAAAALVFGLWPALARAEPVAIEHATVLLPEGPPLRDGTVVLDGGRVVAVGNGVAVPPGARRIDARGAWVTPGLIDASSQAGLVDVDLEAQTDDTDPSGDALQPALRILDGYNPRSVVVPITRAGGVTTVILAPTSGILSGQGAAVDLAGDTVAGALVRAPVAQYAKADEGAAQEHAGARTRLWLRLREAFDDARYFASHQQAFDERRARQFTLSRLNLLALGPVLRGEEPLVVTARRASDIETAIRFAAEYGLRLVVSGADEAWLMAKELAARDVAVIVDPLENLPMRFDRLRARSDNAALLHRAGVRVIIATFSTRQGRLLWQHAANAVRAGMDHEAALRAVTAAPAEAFQLRGYGKLERGAVGNVAVWSGDPLETSTRALHLFVRGEEVPLETRQSLLLRRYRSLPVVRARGP